MPAKYIIVTLVKCIIKYYFITYLFHNDLWFYLTKYFKTFDMFDKLWKIFFKVSHFLDLFKKKLGDFQNMFSLFIKGEIKLIRLIWYVKLHRKHCQINNAKNLQFFTVSESCALIMVLKCEHPATNQNTAYRDWRGKKRPFKIQAARFLVGGMQEATNWYFSPSLSPSFLFSLKINK